MAEKQQDLGKTPEDHQERQSHICPACEREFKEINDYPKVYIASVEIVTPGNVPTEIPTWHREDLLTAPEKRWKIELVPAEVFNYFKDNPNENSLAYSDSFIYYRPYNETQEYLKQEEHYQKLYADKLEVVSDERNFPYRRSFNYSSTMQLLLEQNEPLKEYLASLKEKAGKEVLTKEIFPQWERHRFPNVFKVPFGSGSSNGDEFLLRLNENEERTTEHRVAEVGIWGRGPNMGRAGGPTIQKLLSIGTLGYEGRINHS